MMQRKDNRGRAQNNSRAPHHKSTSENVVASSSFSRSHHRPNLTGHKNIVRPSDPLDKMIGELDRATKPAVTQNTGHGYHSRPGTISNTKPSALTSRSSGSLAGKSFYTRHAQKMHGEVERARQDRAAGPFTAPHHKSTSENVVASSSFSRSHHKSTSENVAASSSFSRSHSHPSRGTARRAMPANRPVYKTVSRQAEVGVHAKPAITVNKDAHVRVVPLGGLEEVGRNMVYFEYCDPKSPYHGDIMIIDMGLQFPEENMPGIDYVIPNIASLIPKRHKIKGIVITHAHYDHIGGIPHLMPKLGRHIPIIGTDLTLAIIKRREEDYQPSSPLNYREITAKSQIQLGAFNLDFFGISHNIPAAVGVVITTPIGVLVHTGDFKIDVKSDIAGHTDMDKIKELGKRNVLLLMSDSTNARDTGHQHSESDIKIEIETIVKNSKGRLIFGTFASLLGRLNEIVQLAERHKKKIVIEGYSMKTNIEIATRLGYMQFDKKTIIPVQEIGKYPPSKVIILATGAQGEDNAALMRIVNKKHKYLRIEKGDTVVFSSSVIPGNERSVQHLTDKLYRDGADVINYKMLDIHAGGHAKQEDLRLMIELIKPKYLMPIEGNHSFLHMHAKIGKLAGLTDDHMIISDNGQVTEAYPDKVVLTKETVPVNYVMVDGLGVGDMQDVVLRDRQALAQDGIFVIVAVVDSQTGKVRGSPDIVSRGFVYLREARELLNDSRKMAVRVIEDTSINMHPVNWEYVKEVLKERVGKYLFTKTEKRPMVLPVIIEV